MAYLGSQPAPKITELDTNTVETVDIQNSAITTAKIADTAVTAAKLATGAAVSNIGFTPANAVSLATVATSGSYDDLSDKPTYVASFNGSTGAVTYTAPVTSVNGLTGAVEITGGFNGAATATMSADRTLTSSSAQTQYLSASTTGLSVYMPDATTLATTGSFVFVIFNTGQNQFKVRDSAGTLLHAINGGAMVIYALIDNSTAEGTWAGYKTSYSPNEAGFNIDVTTAFPVSISSYYKWVAQSSTQWIFYYPVSQNVGSADVDVYYRVYSIVGGSITEGTARSFNVNTGGTTYTPYPNDAAADACRINDTTLAWRIGSWDSYGTQQYVRNRITATTLSGDTLSVGANNNYGVTEIWGEPVGGSSGPSQPKYAILNNGCMFRLSNSAFGIIYNTGVNVGSSANPIGTLNGVLRMRYCTVSGNTVSQGGTWDLSGSTGMGDVYVCPITSTKFLVSMYSAPSTYRTVMFVTWDGSTTLSWPTPNYQNTTIPVDTSGNSWFNSTVCAYDADNQVAHIGFSYGGDIKLSTFDVSGAAPTQLAFSTSYTFNKSGIAGGNAVYTQKYKYTWSGGAYTQTALSGYGYSGTDGYNFILQRGALNNTGSFVAGGLNSNMYIGEFAA